MRKILLPLLFLFLKFSYAREGMWMPQLLKELNESEMKSMGMEISADDIYSINHSSLKDAILQFGGGCTGELISASGLLVTNHHCGFSQIQSLSTIEKNYLADGYWSKSFDEEIPCPGLTITFIREISDVTTAILSGVSDTMNDDSRTTLIKFRTDSIEKSITGKYKGTVRPFYYGNKFYLFKLEVFSDIRFVGAPPKSIGKFGGETDNWMWPRHNCDFSLFRIYADKDNNPATYSKENIPYKSERFLTINIGGVRENDFIFVYGFPGRTYKYLPSSGLETISSQTNPNRIAIRKARLDVMRGEINKGETVRLQYSPRFYTLENSYKKWQGELLGFEKFDPIRIKKAEEEKFISGLKNYPQFLSDSTLLSNYDNFNNAAKPLNFVNDYYAEAFPGIELISATGRFKKLVDLCSVKDQDKKNIQDELKKIKIDFSAFYKNYNLSLDRKICSTVLALSYSKLPKQFMPTSIVEAGNKQDNFLSYTDWLFRNSMVADSSRLMKFIYSFKKNDVKKIINDPAYQLGLGITEIQTKVLNDLIKKNKELNRLQRNYMRDLLTMDTTGKLFPEANSTLRVSYGRVEGTEAVDGIYYNYFTTADGILTKSETGEIDYIIPEKFSTLIKNKDYGRYGTNGKLPVAFLASAHTTGGNSGSPVLNAKGELVGINFDRMWEGVLTDYYYDEKLCRNISVDIRYVLFIIENYGNANRLIEEMRIVK